ncbi:MAG: transposase [Betaproteobacteria bacterium]|nr:transposase [Betaproteobacteria bacterium]
MTQVSIDAAHAASREQGQSCQRAARTQFSLEEKLRIVGEALAGGVRQAHVTRKYGLGKNTLARWKQMLGPLCAHQPSAVASEPPGELERLIARVAELERLLGQRTLEVDLLRQRLQNVRAMGLRADSKTGPAAPSPFLREGR